MSSSGSSPDGEIPVLNYMRREVVGEAELQRTTLRDLGIVAGGSAALRVIYKKPEALKSEQVQYQLLDFDRPVKHDTLRKELLLYRYRLEYRKPKYRNSLEYRKIGLLTELSIY